MNSQIRVPSLLLFISIILLHSLSSVLAIDAPTSLLNENQSIPATRVGPSLSDVLKEGPEFLEDAVEHYTAFAGKFFPILSKLVISPTKARKIWKEVSKVVDKSDLIFIFFIGWLLVPLVGFPYEKLNKGKALEGEQERKHVPFRGTHLFIYLDHLSQACKVAALVYFIDCLSIGVGTMGFSVKDYSQIAAKSIYTAWIFARFRTLKDYLVEKKFGIYRKSLNKFNRGSFGKAAIVSKVSDTVLLLFFAFSMFDVLQVKAGGLIKSLFAVSGAGTLVITVACKDIAADIVSGLSLQASDKIYEGERIVFGKDGKEDKIGTVSKLGWMETDIRFDDELQISVPNKDFSNQRLINMSRMKYCQVEQSLRFNYDDIEKLPSVLDEIKREIRSSCPLAVVDGSRPFRAFFKSYGEEYLEVDLDVHFRVCPDGDEYFQVRQDCLLAIDRAVRKQGVRLGF